MARNDKERVLPAERYKFTWEEGDRLAKELAEVAAAAWAAEEVMFRDQDVRSHPFVQKLAGEDAESAVRYARALVRFAHWADVGLADARRGVAVRDDGYVDMMHFTADHKAFWPRRSAAANFLKKLMLRKLPLEREAVREMAAWVMSADRVVEMYYPLGGIVGAVERLAEREGIAGMEAEVQALAEKLRTGNAKLAAKLDVLTARPSVAGAESTKTALPRAEMPAPVGRGDVLLTLKSELRIPVGTADVSTETVGPDRFPLRADSPFRSEHALLSDFFSSVIGQRGYSNPALASTKQGRLICDRDARAMADVLLACVERVVAARLAKRDLDAHEVWQSHAAASGTVSSLLEQEIAFNRDSLFDFLLWSSAVAAAPHLSGDKHLKELLDEVERMNEESALTEGERHVLHRLRTRLISEAPFGTLSGWAERTSRILGDGLYVALAPGERWADAVNDELTMILPQKRDAWVALLRHARSASSATPNAKFLATSTEALKAIGKAKVIKAFERWLALATEISPSVPMLFSHYVGDTRSNAGVMNESNADVLRGLLFVSAVCPQVTLVRLIADLVLSALRKVPGVGPRAVKVANAGVYALGQLASAKDREAAEMALGQLARLSTKVTFKGTLAQVEKALAAAAERMGVTREDLEEMAVPTFGFSAHGVRAEDYAEGGCTLTITAGGVETSWRNAEGKEVKSPPASLKKERVEELSELKGAAKDAGQMLSAQRERLDRMMGSQKTWEWGAFRERYLEHGIVGAVARRLIWVVDGRGVVFVDGVARDVEGRAIEPGAGATVAVWHPIGRAEAEVLAWRTRLEALRVTQPFKQAHREVYVLTEAERRTGTYSNRFAAHIIRQHQFHALAAARGWKNKLRLMVDDVYPPASKELSAYGLRAEWWVEGIGDNYRTDTNDSGTYLRLATDQVRFYRTGAAQMMAHAGGGGYAAWRGTEDHPMPFELVPPLAFSEVMRDVDLFVGVASVANDPTWADGGPGGRHVNYWQSYSFGELGATAAVRREVLSRLLPRMTKLKGRWELAERFLRVQGRLRGYKIHLGSGNILMEPNDQYLCIVPDRRAAAAQVDFVPFEGDTQMSVILSKALLLIEDDKITDETIVRQIRR